MTFTHWSCVMTAIWSGMVPVMPLFSRFKALRSTIKATDPTMSTLDAEAAEPNTHKNPYSSESRSRT